MPLQASETTIEYRNDLDESIKFSFSVTPLFSLVADGFGDALAKPAQGSGEYTGMVPIDCNGDGFQDVVVARDGSVLLCVNAGEAAPARNSERFRCHEIAEDAPVSSAFSIGMAFFFFLLSPPLCLSNLYIRSILHQQPY